MQRERTAAVQRRAPRPVLASPTPPQCLMSGMMMETAPVSSRRSKKAHPYPDSPPATGSGACRAIAARSAGAVRGCTGSSNQPTPSCASSAAITGAVAAVKRL